MENWFALLTQDFYGMDTVLWNMLNPVLFLPSNKVYLHVA